MKPSRVLAWVLAAITTIGRPCTFSACHADTVTLKDGTVLTGTIDKDGSLVQVFDDAGLRRVVFRDSKIDSTSVEPPGRPERFRLVQPLEVHAGEMPLYANKVEAEPWNELGRRRFKYVGPRSGKPIEMTQAINELSPVAVKYRGVDGFWVGSLDTRSVPRPVVLGLLAKVVQSNKDERIRVAQFMIQAQWYDEAKQELTRLETDFPELKENVATARALLIDAQSRALMEEITRRQAALQPKWVEDSLRYFPTEGVPQELLASVREQARALQTRVAEDRDLARSVQKIADMLPEDARKAIEPRLLEILKALGEAPDAVRSRFEPFRTADPKSSPESRLSLLTTAWAAGPERASADTRVADRFWEARSFLRDHLRSGIDQGGMRNDLVDKLKQLSQADDSNGQAPSLDLATLTEMARLQAPPLHDERAAKAGEPRTIRVHDDPNLDQPSEYTVWLPPEYHPLRSYPAFVILHGRETPAESLAPWLEQAGRRGFVLIAPEYEIPGKPPGYRYTGGEHAAVQLAIRDALKRFAIDANRVFLAGTLEGGNMAWDFALAHPDLFAGCAVISGFPGKYAWPNRANVPLVPMYLVLGDLSSPAEDPIVFEQWAKPLILRNHDVRYVKMYRRGLEPFPEEIPTIMQWASARVRMPAPKQWEAVAGRETDDRFFGVVIRDFVAKRTVGPEAADPMGRNINPAEIKLRANTVLNKLILETSGIAALDVWAGPTQVDFSKRVEIQVNGKSVFKAQPDLQEFAPFLDDLRLRGDRRQALWLKVPVNLGGRQPRG